MDGGRHALVVANDEYDDAGLRRLVAPAQDAMALAEALGDPSVGAFEVQVLHNRSAQEIRFAVEDFFADRAPEDLLLLHFSCHGLKNAAGELYLAVADTRPTRLASTALAADFVNRQMADSRAQRIALFLDCCYGGAFPRGMVVRAAGEAQVRDAFAGQADVGGGRGRVVVTASSAMEYAFEGGQLTAGAEPRPSVFTGAVVDGLTTGEADRDGDGWVGLTELVGYVTDRVHRVTPNQNPQMWTFGASGELLIARSRVRRITPAPLAPALLEAMDSPLTATRFGVVDELRGRLNDADLGQAYAAWQALRNLVDDDSRKVSEAARRGLEEAAPRVTPEVLELADGATAGELRLGGPPIARVAVASSDAPWIRVEQDAATVRVGVEPPAPGEHEGTVVVSGPTGECAVPVRIRVPEPEPQPEPQPVESAMAAEPVVTAAELPAEPASAAHEPAAEQTAAVETVTAAESAKGAASVTAGGSVTAGETVTSGEPVTAGAERRGESPKPAEPAAAVAGPAAAPTVPKSRPAGAVPPWVAVVLAVLALPLIVANYPGAPESHKAWYDQESTGWYVYRSWDDPWILAAITVLVGALVALRPTRSAAVALGVAAGTAITLAESALEVLGAGMAYDNDGEWGGTLVISLAVVAVVAGVLRPKVPRLWPVPRVALALVIAGGLLLVIGRASCRERV